MTDGESDIRLVIADDQTAIREALATVLDLQAGLSVVGTAKNGAQAVAAAEAHRPDVVLMDLNMPEMDGVEATRIISERFPDIAVVVLTTFADEQSILAALNAGARGYLTKDSGRADIARAIRSAAAGQAVMDQAVQRRLKDSGRADIARAIRSAAAGQAVMDPAVQQRLLAAAAQGSMAQGSMAQGSMAQGSMAQGSSTSALAADLTPREIEVLTLVGEGLSNRAIAGRLFVSEATVKTHINNLFAKAQLRDRAHAVHYAFTHGLVRLEQ